MKFTQKSLAVSLAVAALVLSGCTKKPDRPYPGSTVLGPQNTGPVAPADASFGQNTTGLVDRGSDFDPNGHNRTALQSQCPSRSSRWVGFLSRYSLATFSFSRSEARTSDLS